MARFAASVFCLGFTFLGDAAPSSRSASGQTFGLSDVYDAVRMRVTALLAMLGDAAAGAARLSILALPTTTP